MICAQCNGEMSKKWNPQRSAKVIDGSTVVWECGVCGCQLTQAEMKLATTNRRKSQSDFQDE
jgi:hypothetical protein